MNLASMISKTVTMSTTSKDPIGRAILDFQAGSYEPNIIVHSDLCDDDEIPVAHLMRSFDRMPEIEKIALDHCKGSVLDIGAGAGIHALELAKRGFDVTALEISPGGVKYMKDQGIDAHLMDFNNWQGGPYDTLLLLMNGIGIAGSLSNLKNTILHCRKYLKPGGKIICDSSDVKFLYEDEDGSMWVDLASAYYGNFKFQMSYRDEKTDWFDWLYVDPNSFKEIALEAGFEFNILASDEHHYLAELT